MARNRETREAQTYERQATPSTPSRLALALPCQSFTPLPRSNPRVR
jgi:hypothetical protein